MGTGITLMSESQAIFQPPDTGEYKVIYRYEDTYGCIGMDTVRTFVYPATGVTYRALPELRIYPNPAGDQIRIVSNSPVIRVTMYDAAGLRLKQLVVSGDGSAGKKDLNIGTGNLERGVYFMKIETGTGSTVRKFVKM